MRSIGSVSYGRTFSPLARIREKHDHRGRSTVRTDQRRFNEDNGLHPSGVPIAMRPLAGGVANARPPANGWQASGLPWQAGKPALHFFTAPVTAQEPLSVVPPGSA